MDEDYGHPPLEPGKIRVYEDHTGRWYRDVTPEEYELLYNYTKERIQKKFPEFNMDGKTEWDAMQELGYD